LTTRVLVVDDEPDLRLLVRLSLEAFGFEIFEAGNGQEALDAISKDPPDVVLLDIKLPVVDGWEVLRRLREADDPLPVIMLSAHASDTTSKRAMEAGSNGYIAKPFRPKELRDVIEQAKEASSPTA
jgi:two-component system alkaline phosphatase synthesis response regulator PhoP